MVITAIVLIAFIRVEGRRMNVPNLLAPILGTYLVGLSFGLPLFLYFREKFRIASLEAVSYTHLRAHETSLHLVCRLLARYNHQDWLRYIRCLS